MKRVGAVVGGALLIAACTLADTDGLSGGGGGTAPDASSDVVTGGQTDATIRDAAVEAAPPQGCPAAGYSCQPDAPDGWTGPLFVYDGDESNRPACPSQMAETRVDAHTGFHDPGPNTCTQCSCASGSGMSCTTTLSLYDAVCDDTPTTSTVSTFQCAGIPANAGATITMTASGGSCPPTGGVAVKNPPSWDSATRACGAATLLRTGCSDGQVCAPNPPTPFRSKLCVSKSGDVDCPGAPFTVKLLTNDVDDERGCTACTCEPPTATCTGMAARYQGNNCLGAPTEISLPLTPCQVVDANETSYFRIAFTNPSGATCQPGAPAQPTGAATATNPITVCCQN